MVGIVVVSHSAALAEGVVELARQMGGDELPLVAAGGLEDGSIGTDAERVRGAIEEAMSDDGVLVLMDLGSALMSAEMAIEMLDGEADVRLSEAPLVEGAVAAAAAARGGATLAAVQAEASGALRMKAEQLGTQAGEAEAGGSGSPPEDPDALRAQIPVLNEIGLHARPAALVVELAGRFDADLRLAKPGGARPVSARSLTGLMTLSARRGDDLVATASGPQAREALAALEQLAQEGFGEGVTEGPGNASAAATDAREGGDGAAAPAPKDGPARSATTRAEPATAPAPDAGELLRGLPASAGIALGPARRLRERFEAPSDRPSEGTVAEGRRLEDALRRARAAIERDRDEVARRTNAADAAIFDAHKALLEDDALIGAARSRLEFGDTADAAWYAATEEAAGAWRGLDDELLRERAADVEDVGRRVLAVLAGREPRAKLDAAGIVVADELAPADAASLDPEAVQGIAAARGTATAHAAILARALGIPAVVGLGPAVLAIADGTELLLDGGEGTVVVSPDEETTQRARREREQAAQRRERARRRARESAVTSDGTEIEVAANLGGAGEVGSALELGADGVGLLRTEFLFLDRREIPSEDEQAETIAEIARALDGRPLIVRTLDAGADKPLPALPIAPEQNPFLGQRGIRLSLEHPELLAAQLRAVLRVAAEHPIKVMFPMVATAAELDAARDVLAQARVDTGIEAPLEVGIMVEVPAAALQAQRLAEAADFFSIGTNDLTQYVMAAERGNEQVGQLLAGPQPAVLRLVRATVEGARRRGRWVGVCGELAGDPAAAVLLVGLGVRELSMAPALVPQVKEALRSIALQDASAAAERAIEAADAVQARSVAAALLE